MSNKCAGFVVVLDQDLSSEQAAEVVAALHHFRGVIGVEPVADDARAVIAECRARAHLTDRLLRLIQERP